MDYEYEGEEPYESRVLWGRVGVYAGSLLLVFILGSCIGGGGASESEVLELRRQVRTLHADNERLEQTIAAQGAAGADPGAPRISVPDENGTEGTEPAEDSTDAAGTPDASGNRTYQVQSGDTLSAIAQRVYGDSQKFTLIQQANDLDGQLVVGQELIIPPDE
jgi:nucleoid-associated protein YgaU